MTDQTTADDSGFLHEQARTAVVRNQGVTGPGELLYTRMDTETWHPFEEALAALEGARHGVVFGSGMAAVIAAVGDVPGVERVLREPTALVLTVRNAPAAVAPIVTAATGAGMALSDVEISRPDLESVFLHLTGKALRD